MSSRIVCALLMAAWLCQAPSAMASSSSPATPGWSTVKATAPKARTARRASFLVFARSDRAALDDRRAAARAALALADGPKEQSARLAARLAMAELAVLAGDDATVGSQLRAARTEGRGLGWIDADDDAAALVSSLDLDQVIGTAQPWSSSSLPASWASRAAKVRASAATSKGRPPRSSVFAARRELADLLAAERTGLSAALEDASARKRLRRALGALGGARGRRDTAALRAFALEVRAVLALVEGKVAEAALDLLRADRLRALDPGVAVDALPPVIYAGRERTRAFCALVEQGGASGHPAVSCDAIEEKKLGGVTFVDASRAPEHPFSAEEAQATLADYDVLVLRCLKQGAKEGLTTQTVIQLEWGIGNDGLVRTHDLRPMRLRDTSVDRCLHDARQIFRFARYPGEMQHLRLEIEVGGEL